MIRNPFNTKLTRRELLTLFLAGIFPLNLRAFTPTDSPEYILVLRALLDTLIPADDITPSASALGIHQEIIDGTSSDFAYDQLIQLGCRWLNHQSNGDFTNLQMPQRIQILQWMEQADRHSLPALFFNRLRYEAMALYYSQPASWKGLGLERPPQPLGYMDYQS